MMLNISVLFLELSVPLYAAALLGVFPTAKRGGFPKLVFRAGLFAGTASQLVSVLLRGIAVGRLPVANVFEFIVLFSVAIAIYTAVTQRNLKSPLQAAAALLVTVALSIAASLMNKSAAPLAPSLRSPWLQFHVISAILSYGSFGVSFCMALAYLRGSRKSVMLPAHQEELEKKLGELDRKIYKAILSGYLFVSLVLLSGAVWAEQVWGSWWSWDPKETFALITWLVYTFYLHFRVTKGQGGIKSAWVAVAGFIVVLFTLFGVTWLLPGLHSYT